MIGRKGAEELRSIGIRAEGLGLGFGMLEFTKSLNNLITQ
jgi:hypothetical protein